MQSKKIFYKYCKKYFSIFLGMVVCSFLIAAVGYRNLSKYCIEMNELQLQKNITQLNDDISKMNMIVQLINQDNSMKVLIRQNDKSLPNHALSLKNVNEMMQYLSTVYSSSPYYFTLFNRNNSFVSTEQCSSNFENYYGKFMSVTANEKLILNKDIKSILFREAKDAPCFLSVDLFSTIVDGRYTSYENAILCIIGGTNNGLNPSFLVTFVLDYDDIVSRVLPSELQANGFLQIEDSSGNVILSYCGNSDSKQQKYIYNIADLLTITIGFPKSVISQQTLPILLWLLLLIIVSFSFALFMSLYLSKKETTRLNQLFNAIQIDSFAADVENEYDILTGIIKKVSEDLEVYHNRLECNSIQNQAIRLENLIIHGINTPEQKRIFEHYFNQTIDFFCITIIHIYTDDDNIYNMSSMLIKEYFKELYGDSFISVHTNIHEEIFFFSFPQKDYIILESLRKQISDILNTLTLDIHINFNAGISSIGTDIACIQAKYNQAMMLLQLYGNENENIVCSFPISHKEENLISLEFLNHLLNLLLSAKVDRIQEQFNQLNSNYRCLPLQYEEQKQQVFFSIRNIIYNAAIQASINISDSVDIPTYHHNMSFEELMSNLEHAAIQICDNIEASRKSHNYELKEKIISYINDNYNKPELSPAMICKEVGISEKYLSQFIKEQTGETLTEYLEKLRINKAEYFLINTNYSNEKISEETGFTSITTFYRAFQRRNKVSPGTYRQSRKNQEQINEY